MNPSATAPNYSANEAACVTGVPLKQVHRIIDAGLLDGVATGDRRARTVNRDGLVGLKLAHETTDMLTLDGRRQLVRYLLENPKAKKACARDVSVDLRSIKAQVRNGLTRLAKARAAVTCDDAVLSGTSCFRGTRIPVHDIADMLANGDSVRSIREAFPRLSEAQIELAALHARAWPRRGRPRRQPFWRGHKPAASSEVALDEVLRAP